MKEHLYDAYRNKKQTGKFVVIGSIGFVCNYLVLKLGTSTLGLDRVLAEVLAVAIALQVTFVLHDRWTYSIDKSVHKYHLSQWGRYRAYLFSNSFGSLLTIGLFSLFSFFLNHFLSLAFASGISLVWNFLMNKAVIWHHKAIED